MRSSTLGLPGASFSGRSPLGPAFVVQINIRRNQQEKGADERKNQDKAERDLAQKSGSIACCCSRENKTTKPGECGVISSNFRPIYLAPAQLGSDCW